MEIEKIVGIAILPATAAAVYFVMFAEPSREIIATAISPAPLIATIDESSMGATTPFLYRVVVRTEPDDEGLDVFKVTHPDGLSLKWVAPEHLLICFERADIFYARDFFSFEYDGRWVGGVVSRSRNTQDCSP